MKAAMKKERIPLYRSIASIIGNKITSGQYEPGCQLPTEDELTQQYKVSKITVRNALMLLEMDDLITRKWGKGNFVTDKVPEQRKLVFTNLIDITRLLTKTVTKPLEIEKVTVKTCRNPRDVCDFFSMTMDDTIGLIRRSVLRKNILLFYENYLPVDLIQHITKTELVRKKSVQEIFKEKIGLKATKGKMYLEALPAEPDIARIIECQTFDPIIRMQTFFWSGDKVPFEIVNVYFHASVFKYSVDVEIEN